MDSALGQLSGWWPYAIGAVAGFMLHLLWSKFSSSASQSLPTHWNVSAKAAHTPRDRHYYTLIRQTFPALQVMMKIGLLQFLVPDETNKEAAAVKRYLNEATVSFLLCTREGRAIAAIDVLESKQQTAPLSAVKRAALSRAQIRYIEIPAEPLATQELLQMLVQSDQFEGGTTASDFSDIVSRSFNSSFGVSQQSFSSTRDQLSKTVESNRQSKQQGTSSSNEKK